MHIRKNNIAYLFLITFCCFYSIKLQAHIAKTLFKWGGKTVKISMKYDAIKLISKYGDNAGQIINKYGDDGVVLLNKYGDDAIKMTKKYGVESSEILMKYGDNAISVSKKYGDDGIKLLEKNSVVCKNLTTVNASKKLISTVAKFSEKGINTTGAILVKLQQKAPKNKKKFLEFIAKFGEKGSEFIWKNIDTGLKIVGNNKKAIVITAMIVYGFSHPEDVHAAMKLSKEVATHALSVGGDVLNTGIKTVAKEVISKSYILQITIGIVILLTAILLLRKFKLFSFVQSKQTTDKEPPSWT